MYLFIQYIFLSKEALTSYVKKISVRYNIDQMINSDYQFLYFQFDTLLNDVHSLTVIDYKHSYINLVLYEHLQIGFLPVTTQNPFNESMGFRDSEVKKQVFLPFFTHMRVSPKQNNNNLLEVYSMILSWIMYFYSWLSSSRLL